MRHRFVLNYSDDFFAFHSKIKKNNAIAMDPFDYFLLSGTRTLFYCTYVCTRDEIVKI
jgi:hypothetical protein